MANERSILTDREIQKMKEIIRDYKSGKIKLKGCEFIALSEYLNSLINR